MIETIERDYYKVTFVRDPLSRMLSAYRDKFTGDFFLNFGNTVDILNPLSKFYQTDIGKFVI